MERGLTSLTHKRSSRVLIEHLLHAQSEIFPVLGGAPSLSFPFTQPQRGRGVDGVTGLQFLKEGVLAPQSSQRPLYLLSLPPSHPRILL